MLVVVIRRGSIHVQVLKLVAAVVPNEMAPKIPEWAVAGKISQ